MRTMSPKKTELQDVITVEAPVTAEAAAEELMSYLPEDHQMFIREAAAKMALPVWQVLLGYAVKAAERFELFSPIILSSWESRGKPNTTRPCENCKIEFFSRYPDAKFCCDKCFFNKLDEQGHSDTCPTKKDK